MTLEEFAQSMSWEDKKEVFNEHDNKGAVIELLINELAYNEDNNEEILKLLRDGRDEYMKNWMEELDDKDDSEEYLDNKERI